jgi:hypothetical protein
MKKLSIFILLLSISPSFYAQDLIVDQDGKRISCYITKEDSLQVYFDTEWNNTRISTFIKRDDISMIRYDYFLIKKQKSDSIRLSDNYIRCITVGVLNGGGSLLGMDTEFGFTKSLAIQVGVGYIGFGAGMNFHFKPTLRSSFFSLQYWHQGVGETYSQSLFGPSVVFRARKIFTAQIGLGFALEKGPAWPESMKQPPVMLTYSIGVYFPQ